MVSTNREVAKAAPTVNAASSSAASLHFSTSGEKTIKNRIYTFSLSATDFYYYSEEDMYTFKLSGNVLNCTKTRKSCNRSVTGRLYEFEGDENADSLRPHVRTDGDLVAQLRSGRVSGKRSIGAGGAASYTIFITVSGRYYELGSLWFELPEGVTHAPTPVPTPYPSDPVPFSAARFSPTYGYTQHVNPHTSNQVLHQGAVYNDGKTKLSLIGALYQIPGTFSPSNFTMRVNGSVIARNFPNSIYTFVNGGNTYIQVRFGNRFPLHYGSSIDFSLIGDTKGATGETWVTLEKVYHQFDSEPHVTSTEQSWLGGLPNGQQISFLPSYAQPSPGPSFGYQKPTLVRRSSYNPMHFSYPQPAGSCSPDGINNCGTELNAIALGQDYNGEYVINSLTYEVKTSCTDQQNRIPKTYNLIEYKGSWGGNNKRLLKTVTTDGYTRYVNFTSLNVSVPSSPILDPNNRKHLIVASDIPSCANLGSGNYNLSSRLTAAEIRRGNQNVWDFDIFDAGFDQVVQVDLRSSIVPGVYINFLPSALIGLANPVANTPNAIIESLDIHNPATQPTKTITSLTFQISGNCRRSVSETRLVLDNGTIVYPSSVIDSQDVGHEYIQLSFDNTLSIIVTPGSSKRIQLIGKVGTCSQNDKSFVTKLIGFNGTPDTDPYQHTVGWPDGRRLNIIN